MLDRSVHINIILLALRSTFRRWGSIQWKGNERQTMLIWWVWL